MDPVSETMPIDPVIDPAPVTSPTEIETDGESLKNNKKARGRTVEMEKKRVAELILVLSAMAEMRGGGTKPVLKEMEMMEEARAKVAVICGSLKPKDVVKSESIGSVIEDLGLKRKVNDESGLQPCKMSISEKYSLAKRKIEESKEFALRSRVDLLHKQTGSGQAVESRGASQTNGMVSTNKSFHGPIVTSGSISTASRIGTSTYQFPTNQNSGPSSMIPSGLPGSRLVRDPSSAALPVRGMERANFRLGQRTVPGQDSSINQTPVKVEAPVAKMLVQGPPVAAYTHQEIGNTVHKFLQSRLPKQQTWTPPSRAYMRKPLNCQICQLVLNEVHNLLVCDSCEKGYHLKCLQATNQNGAPRGEWHCPKCLMLSSGKPLPPKYGCVMRNTPTLKLPVL